MEYKDIEVEVTDPKRERTADKKWMGHFKVRVLHSEAGEMADTEAVPVQYDLKELRTGLKRLEKRKLDREGLIDLGLTLAMLLLPPGEQGSPSNVRGLFAESLNLAGQDAGLTFCHNCLRERDGIIDINDSQEVFRSWHKRWVGKARLQSIWDTLMD